MLQELATNSKSPTLPDSPIRKTRLADRLARTLAACAATVPVMVCASPSADWEAAQHAFADLDDRSAIVLLRRAADGGDPRAMLALGLALRHGDRLFPAVLRTDGAESARWLSRLASDAEPVGTASVPKSKRTTLGLYLSAAQAHAMKSAPASRVLLLDVRTRAEAAYVGMAAGVDALVPYMEHDEFMSDWDPARATFKSSPNSGFAEDVLRLLDERGLGRDTPLILICRSGDRSARAVDRLAAMGLSQVYTVVDGFEGDLDAQGRRHVNGWKNAQLPWSYRLDQGVATYARRY